MDVKGMSTIIRVVRHEALGAPAWQRRLAAANTSGEGLSRGFSIACLRWWPEIDLGQLQLIEADILIIIEGIGKNATVFDLRQQPLDIEAVRGGAAGREEVDGGGEEIPGAEDVALP